MSIDKHRGPRKDGGERAPHVPPKIILKNLAIKIQYNTNIGYPTPRFFHNRKQPPSKEIFNYCESTN
jgi:hypothetical protein